MTTHHTHAKTQAENLHLLNTTKRRHGQAHRLVNTRQIDRNTWLTIRKIGIGSSDAASAVGLNPYKSQLELWMEKTGRLNSTLDNDANHPDNDDNTPLFWGTVLEPIVAEHYAKRTGHKVRRVNAILQHKDYPWMLANLDREVAGSSEVQILECKTAGINGAKLWRDGVPEYVQLQVMHQLAITGQDAADVAVLVGGNELRIFRLIRDEALIDRLVALESEFWRHVTEDTPPPADASDSAQRALRSLYPDDDHEVLDLTEQPALAQAFEQLKEVRSMIEGAKKEEAQFKHQLQQAMGTASEALFPAGRITWKKSTDTRAVDLARLKQEQPEVVKQYSNLKPGSRRFVVHQR
ncbi:YqaJ viral recombinase family protein [Neptunomonas qingdaonensis]|uniref:Putative phage-type endonuclease n=1 Tax=Neptunomonas qingdaonensis TaxID=1045558 RepID=A0A1I2QDT7_9GAMM|nr:YqaJ viral recombinase family protein [Neptunomonas qingdaonensis]SFG24427.1 putative phage-type endonuclease [Neptunomonas qingdaonensis]